MNEVSTYFKATVQLFRYHAMGTPPLFSELQGIKIVFK